MAFETCWYGVVVPLSCGAVGMLSRDVDRAETRMRFVTAMHRATVQSLGNGGDGWDETDTKG